MQLRRGFIYIYVLVGMIFILGVGAFLYYQSGKNSNDAVDPRVQKIAKEQGVPEDSVEIALVIGRNNVKVLFITGLKTAFELYVDKYKRLPESLSELSAIGFNMDPKMLKHDLGETPIFYARSSQKNSARAAWPASWHFGIELETADRFRGRNLSREAKKRLEELKKELEVLNRDRDFDSQNAGYINGFNGRDPVYDITP